MLTANKMLVVHPIVDENGRNLTFNGTGYFDFLREEVYGHPFARQQLEKGTGGCKTAPRYIARQKQKKNSPKSFEAE